MRGSAIIFILWVISFLLILVSEIAFHSSLIQYLSLTAKYRIEYYPEAVECLKSIITVISENRTLYNFDIQVEKKVFRINITDESGKINLNKADEKTLLDLMQALNIESPEKDIIVDSIMDWRDPDEFHRLNGAESDYYERLNPPYKSKNGPFDSIEELLLIRGITPEIFNKLKNYFTVYDVSGKVNVNTADKELLILKGIPEEIAEEIIKERKKGKFKDLDDLRNRINIDSISDDVIDHLSFSLSNTVKIDISIDKSLFSFIVKMSANSVRILDVK